MDLNILLTWFLVYKYWILFVFGVVEGPMVTVAAGLLIHQGQALFWPVYVTMMMADLVGDAFWYYVGYHGAHRFAKRFGKFFGVTESRLEKTAVTFKKHQNKILFFSKISLGFGMAVGILMVAGMVRVPFKKFLAINAVGQFLWTGFLLSLGYFFGNFYSLFDKGFHRIFEVVLLVFVFFICSSIGKYLRSRNVVDKV